MVDHQLSQVGRYSQAELSTGMTGAIFFNKMGHPWPLFHLFLSFQTNITIFTTDLCEKCPSSIRCWDSNRQLSEN